MSREENLVSARNMIMMLNQNILGLVGRDQAFWSLKWQLHYDSNPVHSVHLIHNFLAKT